MNEDRGKPPTMESCKKYACQTGFFQAKPVPIGSTKRDAYCRTCTAPRCIHHPDMTPKQVRRIQPTRINQDAGREPAEHLYIINEEAGIDAAALWSRLGGPGSLDIVRKERDRHLVDDYEFSGMSQRKLAKLYGISQKQVSIIVNRPR